MIKEIVKRHKLEKNIEKVEEEKFITLRPHKNKCFMNKKTGHKFIHTIKGIGLAIQVKEKDLELYEEVKIK